MQLQKASLGCISSMLQALRRSGVRDPVLLLDEVDKMGHDSLRGDPASALLEVLDPNQNQAFVDTYLNVPFDLSQVKLCSQPCLCVSMTFPVSLYGDTSVQAVRSHLTPKLLTSGVKSGPMIVALSKTREYNSLEKYSVCPAPAGV